MKRTLYYIAFLLLAVLLPTGCSEDPLLDGETPSKKVNWRFSVLMPDARPSTRAFGETANVTSLHVAVFSKVGGSWFLKELAEATDLTPIEGSPDNETEFSVELSESPSEARRIHLIANYPGLSFSFGDDATLVGLLSVNHNKDVYWGCLEDTITNANPPQRVPLVRNFAKIELKVENNVTNFKLTGFGLHNMPDKGTVAPYNNREGEFAQFMASDNVCNTYKSLFEVQGYEGNEPYDMNTIAFTDAASEGFHVPAADGTVAPFYICERRNRGVENPTSVIVKGIYDGKETYYKLDIIYQDSVTNTNVYYNLLRNFIYNVRIKSVDGPGYDSLADALRNPASNNVAGSTEVNEFTNISNGKGHLYVSTTYLLMVTENPVDIYYQYRPDIKKPEEVSNNHKGQGADSPVTISAPTGINVVLNKVEPQNTDVNETTDLHYKWRKITLTPNTPGTAKEQKITMAAGGLQREITLVLRKPYDMTVKVDPKTKEVPKINGMYVKVWTSIPSGLSPKLFPLLFTYSTEDNTLYPLAASGMYANTANGTYGFVYELGYEEYAALQKDPDDDTKVMFDCLLQTNCAESASVVYVDNQYFNRGSDNFLNNSKTFVPNVNVQRVGGRYPQTLDDSGVSVADVKHNGNIIGTVTISRSKVVAADYVIPSGAQNNDDLTFEFSDNYYWDGTWNGPITYTAESTVGALNENETTLYFKTTFSKTIEILQDTRVTVPTDSRTYTSWGSIREVTVYPKNLQEQKSQEVSVLLDGNEVGTLTINQTSVTTGISLVVPDDYDLSSSTLFFSFEDYVCDQVSSSGFNNITYTWRDQPVTYKTDEYQVSDIGKNNFIITFKHP